MNLKIILFFRSAIVSILILIVASACSKPVEILLPNGIVISEIKQGDGHEAASLDRVTIHYTGYLEENIVFDTSLKPGREPLRFTIDIEEVIKGLEEGVKGMKKGGQRKIIIPADLGYGENGVAGKIPPNSRLTFEVEMLKIETFE